MKLTSDCGGVQFDSSMECGAVGYAGGLLKGVLMHGEGCICIERDDDESQLRPLSPVGTVAPPELRNAVVLYSGQFACGLPEGNGWILDSGVYRNVVFKGGDIWDNDGTSSVVVEMEDRNGVPLSNNALSFGR